MHDCNNKDLVWAIFIQDGKGKAMDQAASDIPSGFGPASRMLCDLVDCVLDFGEKILAQPTGLPLIVERRLQHLIFSGLEQASRLHLIFSYAWANTSLADFAEMAPFS